MSSDAPKPALIGARLGLTLLAAGLIAAVWLRISRPVIIGASEAATSPISVGMRIDVNEATVAELTLLPGVGPTLARRIVEDRAARGPFGSVDDLARVPGIGPGIVGWIRPYAAAWPQVGSERQ
ncbi:MAG: ComEA family DNA-binding protein [Planctomycetota bacterium]|jgi:competence protein ComEA